MKIRNLLFCLILSNVALAQLKNYEVGIGYTYTMPLATMKQNINDGNGITANFYLTPEKLSRLSFGMDFNYTIYGQDKSKQEYTFNDGTTERMDIIVNNAFLNFMGGTRYLLTSEQGKTITPYVSAKAGYSWFRTDLNIYDPDDDDHCEPVDHDLLLKDGTFAFSGGAGAYWDIFKKKRPNRLLFNLEVNMTLGGKVNYMNTDAPTHSHPNHQPSDVTAQFINTQTQIVHEHHVGYVYSSYLEMVEIRGGFIFRR